MVFNLQISYLIHKLHHPLHHYLKIRMSVNMNFSLFPIESQGRNKPWQSIDVIAMKMRDKDMIDSAHLKSELSQLDLGSLAAINHEKLLIELYNL